MKISLSPVEEKKCKKFLEIKENNIDAVNILIDYLLSHNFDIKEEDVDKSNLTTSYSKAFFKALDIDEEDKYIQELIKTNNIDKFVCLNPEEYLNNPYVLALKDLKIKDKDFELAFYQYKKYEAFVYDEILVDPLTYKEITPMGYFIDEFPFLALVENGLIWMSLIPHEINTMKEPISKAKGDVLVLGLGLGYYAYMISLKEEVNKITIIENDERIIKLFKQYLLPRFTNKEKITIIYDDAFKYLKKNHHHDYIFTDIYHNVEDGLPLYLKIKQFENKYPNATFAYWIEESLISMLRRQLLTIFEEQYYEHFSDKDYLNAKNNNDKIINCLYWKSKDYRISSFDDLHALLTKESIATLVKDLKINF